MSNIVRVKKGARYFSASNEPFNDERLSWESRGLMGYLLSKPNDWTVRMEDLEKRGPAGEYKLRRMLLELRKCGYVNRIRYQVEGGTFEWETHVYESPSLNPTPSKEVITTSRLSTSGSPTSGLSTRGSATRGKPRDILSTDSPNTEQPNTEEEKTEDDKEVSRRSEIFSIFEDNITMLTPILADTIDEWIKSYPHQWIIDAIGIAAENSKRRASYVKGILENWRVEGRNDSSKSNLDPDSPEYRKRYITGKFAEFVEH